MFKPEETEAQQSSAHGFATRPAPILPKTSETVMGPPVVQPKMKMDVIPAALVPHPVTIPINIPGVMTTQTYTAGTMSQTAPIPAASTEPTGIGGLIPTTGPISTISTSLSKDSVSLESGAPQSTGLKEGSVDPFLGVNLTDLDVFNVDPSAVSIDSSFDDIPLPEGTSIDNAILYLVSIDMSSFKDFLESALPNPSSSTKTDGHQREQTTAVTVEVPQQCNYRIDVANQYSSQTSPSSPPIPASRVVPRAKALAAATADLYRNATCATHDVPRRGHP